MPLLISVLHPFAAALLRPVLKGFDGLPVSRLEIYVVCLQGCSSPQGLLQLEASKDGGHVCLHLLALFEGLIKGVCLCLLGLCFEGFSSIRSPTMSTEYDEMEYEGCDDSEDNVVGLGDETDYEQEADLDVVPSSLPPPKGRSPVRGLLQKHAAVRSSAARALFVAAKSRPGSPCVTSKLTSSEKDQWKGFNVEPVVPFTSSKAGPTAVPTLPQAFLPTSPALAPLPRSTPAAANSPASADNVVAGGKLSSLAGTVQGLAAEKTGLEKAGCSKFVKEGSPVSAGNLPLIAFASGPPPVLKVCEINDCSPRLIFEGKVLNKYGTYRFVPLAKQEHAHARYLKCDLVDSTGFDTVTLSITDPYINVFEGKIAPGKFLRIEGPVVALKNRNDYGTCSFSLQVDATTSILKAEPFEVCVNFFPETKLRSFLDSAAHASSEGVKNFMGTVAFVLINADALQGSSKSGLLQYTVVDGAAPQDRATLCFVNERKADYFRLGELFQNGGPVMLVARNIGAWQARSNTLSVLDATILCPLSNKRLERELETVFVQQVASLGYGTQLYGVFEALNINSILVHPICATCKSTKVMREAGSEGHCFSCSAAVQLVENEKVEGRIVLRNRRSVAVTLSGSIVDKVLGLPEAFKSLYARSVFEAREALAVAQQTGTFVLNHMGAVIDFTPEGCT